MHSFVFCLWVCMEVSLCLLLSISTMSALAKESYPLHPDSCSLNKEEWPWIFPSCTHIRRHSVLQRTPAIPTLSGETSVLRCSIRQSGLWHFSYTLPVNSTQLRELTQNEAKLRPCCLISFKALQEECQPATPYSICSCLVSNRACYWALSTLMLL